MSRCLLLKAIFIMTVISAQSYPRILVHGHRGARAVRPENTLPAFEYAIGIGVDVLELDLAVTKDNVLVVSHDPVLPEKTCQGPAGATRVIREMTLEQLREWDCGSRPNTVFPKQQPVPLTGVPTFDEVLALAPRGKFEFNVETKIFAKRPELTPDPERFAQLLIDAVRRHKVESRVIIQSFDFRTLEAAALIAPGIRRSALYSGPPRDLVTLTRVARASICSPEYRLVTPTNVRALHDAGLQVVPWTANDSESWQRLIDAGVDAIITDDPAELIGFLKQKKLR